MAHIISFRTRRFDVTTETPNPTNPIAGQSVLRWLRAELATSNTPLPMLIQWAYQLDEGRLIGVPAGFNALRFDVVAKAPEQEPVAGQMQLMMRALLAERFKLLVHHETVSLDVTSASDVSMDTLALVTTYRAPGQHAADTSADGFAPIPSNAPDSKVDEYPMYWLAALDVESRSAAGTIVAVGDSWIDGRCSTTEDGRVRPDLYQRWIDILAARLAKERPTEPRAVVNAGIGGNRIIPGGGNGSPTLQRLDRDVLERAGATHVIFQQGMNDLGGGATAAQVTAAMQQVIDRVHARGLRIIGGTLFPLARPDVARWTREMDAERLAVNEWMRTLAKFDGVIDFDKLMSGGPVYNGSESLKLQFVCTDNVHPNPAGYRAMGEFVDLALFNR